MSNFVNTVDSIGDEVLTKSLLDGSIKELLDESVETLRASALQGCTQLSSVKLPSLTSTKSYALASTKLTSANSNMFPALTSIEKYTFDNCTNLKTVSLPSVSTLGTYAFNKCTNLKTVSLPSVSRLESNTFNNCNSLVSVDLPSATDIRSYAFSRCTELTRLNIPLVTSIDDGVFMYADNLTRLDCPSLTYLGQNGFHKSGGGKHPLDTLILRANTTVRLLYGGGLSNTRIATNGSNGYVYVPRDLVEDYKAHTSWSSYADKIRAIEDYPVVCGPIGKEWKKSKSLSDSKFSFIKHINGLWVVSCSGGLYTSTDLQEWTRVHSSRRADIDLFKGVWITCDDNKGIHYTSDDLSTWTPSNITDTKYERLIHNDDIIIAYDSMAARGLLYSTDGMTWNQSNLTSGRYYVYYGDGLWVAVPFSNATGLYYSTDGMTWNQSNLTSTKDNSTDSAAYGDGLWVATLDSGIYNSIDGMTWSKVYSMNYCQNLSYSNGKWFTSNSSGKMYYSSDGATWNPCNIYHASYVTYGDGLWVAVARHSSSSSSNTVGVYYSLDGIHWTISNIEPLSEGAYFHPAIYAEGKWAFAGSSGNSGTGIYYSDGLE